MPSRNQIPAAAGTPKSVPEPFSIKRARSTGSVATQYQSDLELLDTLLVCFIGLSFPLWLAAGGGHQLLGIVLALALDLGEIIGSQRDIRRGEVLFQQMEGAQLFR